MQNPVNTIFSAHLSDIVVFKLYSVIREIVNNSTLLFLYSLIKNNQTHKKNVIYGKKEKLCFVEKQRTLLVAG